MKYNLYMFSGEMSLSGSEEGDLNSAITVVSSSGLSPAEVLQQRYDIISFRGADFAQFVPLLKVIDWNINQLGYADCLVLRDGIYKPYNSTAEAVLRIIKNNSQYVNTLLPVIIVGELSFVIAVSARLATAGFHKIIVSPIGETQERHAEIRNKLRSFSFNLDIEVILPVELTAIESTSCLLVSNFTREDSKEAYELMAYFNFLIPGALFIDCKSQTDGSLAEEARRAEISVVGQNEVLKTKCSYLIELAKNSSLV